MRNDFRHTGFQEDDEPPFTFLPRDKREEPKQGPMRLVIRVLAYVAGVFFLGYAIGLLASQLYRF